MEETMFIDPQRCIGCRACVAACRECATHKGYSMIFVDYIDRAETTATMPTVCMHCNEPTCALVCPADAIKVSEEGVVMTALKPRCLDCRNCVNACPFGVPKYNTQMHLQMKCDMCYDRSSVGLKPMCASVCPSQALFFGTREELEAARPQSAPIDRFHFGQQTITTKVKMMAPRRARPEHLDVTAALDADPPARSVRLEVLNGHH
jgi:Fe-S-cluster-containing dehydrogenase component